MNVEAEIGRLSREAKTLAEFLSGACRLRGKGVTRAAEEAGLARNAISSFICGTREPSTRSVHLLARYFGVGDVEILRLVGYADATPHHVLDGVSDVVLNLIRGLDEEEIAEWLEYGEMMMLRRQRRLMEAGREEVAGGGEVEGKSD